MKSGKGVMGKEEGKMEEEEEEKKEEEEEEWKEDHWAVDEIQSMLSDVIWWGGRGWERE